ncbi:MAG: PD-(D/E)XK nuclease family protein, partial [Muribaculaceae bacterium]|nr:PD-(D/E)XK nuclease family protein [Muribaculaceae bacterium]
MSQPFLKSLARAYTANYTDLSDFMFVFPNRRACTFFQKELAQSRCEGVMVLPKVTTMSDMVEEVCGLVPAGRIEQLFILYKVYCGLLSKEGETEMPSFDRFRRWGETALSDFNEVDMQDVDADAIFKNIKDVREISSNFLTEEQLKVMEEYFGYDAAPARKAENFWKTFNDNENSLLHSKFRLIWQVMGPLYHAFHRALSERGLINTGGAYRMSADILEKDIPATLPYHKIVMAGFNALTASERRIFDALSSYTTDEDDDEPFADFFWDIPGPVINDETSTAGRYVLLNSRRWPMPEWAAPIMKESDEAEMPPAIRVISVPSNSMQAKVVSEEVEKMAGRLPASDFSEAKVAVVLPDEGLLIPMLYTLPEGVKDVNLTMGYPVKLTAVSTYVSLLRRLQGSRRKYKGKTGYYYKDLEGVLSHPFSQVLFGNGVERVKEWIKTRHRAVVDVDELDDVCPLMKELFRPFADDEGAAPAMEWLDKILERIRNGLEVGGVNMVKSNVDKATIDVYRLALTRMSDISGEYGIDMEWRTFLALTERLIAGETVTFEGQPLVGLQVMGLLETRALDFERIIIPSLNERIMPARRRSRTFISDSLRQAYGLPPVNYAESLFAYYFFRMIARAKEVVLLYDSRSSDGMRSGDVSRYVLQLKYLYAARTLKMESRNFVIAKSDLKPTEINKENDEDIMTALALFRDPGEDGRNLSATALTCYASCQMQFYFRHILRIRDDEESSEYIDSMTQGNIVHYVMEHIYLPEGKRKKYLTHPVIIDAEYINEAIQDVAGIDRLIREGVNLLHFHLPETAKDEPLQGSSEYVAKVLRKQIINVLEFDLKQAPFRLYGVEIEGNVAVRMRDGGNVNMRFAIDRLDSSDLSSSGSSAPPLRIVDYKTGTIHADAVSMAGVFQGEYTGKNLLQLWLYANIFDALPEKEISGKHERPVIDLFGRDKDSMLPYILELYDINKVRDGKHNYPVVGKITQQTHAALNEE